MGVVAVIPTFNRSSQLNRCLEALAAQTVQPAAIYVVDNASTDGTREMIADHWHRAVHYRCLGENAGAARGFQEAIRWALDAGQEWIWLTDDDSVPAPNSLERLLAARRGESGVVALVPKKLTPEGRLWCGEVILDGDSGVPYDPPVDWYNSPDNFDCDWAPNTGMLIHQEAVLRAGTPFAELFAWGEDTEYCLRLRRLGRIVVVPDSVVVHPNPSIGWPVPYAALWKLYYVHRNEVYLRLRDLKPPKRSLLRTIRDCSAAVVSIVIKQDHPRQRLFVYFLATWHGITGRLGRAPRWVHKELPAQPPLRFARVDGVGDRGAERRHVPRV